MVYKTIVGALKEHDYRSKVGKKVRTEGGFTLTFITVRCASPTFKRDLRENLSNNKTTFI